MKNMLIALMVLLGGALLVACSSIASASENIISTSSLVSDSTESIEKTEEYKKDSTNKYFEFDFSINKAYKKVYLWVERYKLGEKVEDATGKNTGKIEESGKIIVTTAKTNSGISGFKERFNLKVVSNVNNSEEIAENGMDVIEGILPKEGDYTSCLWSVNEIKDDPIKNDLILGSICYSSQEKINELPSEFYDNVDENINSIKNIDDVYLIKCKFVR